jgi:transcription antitermination factor NusG
MTKPNAEGIAAANLTRQGFDHYYPRFLFQRPDKTVSIRPLFPRYMFISIIDRWYSLLGTRGISRLLMADGGPALLSDIVIEQLRQREGKDGFITLVKPRFKVGAKVRVDTGPFSGHLAIYEGMTHRERVRVLIDLLGQKVRVALDEKSLSEV